MFKPERNEKMQARIEELRVIFKNALAAANDAEALEALRIDFLGKKGQIAELMKGLRDVADKKAAGQLINTFKEEVETSTIICPRSWALRLGKICCRYCCPGIIRALRCSSLKTARWRKCL